MIIEAEMWVRGITGHIDFITKITNSKIYSKRYPLGLSRFYAGTKKYIPFEEVFKNASFNKLDIIEKDDYVNGERVIRKATYKGHTFIEILDHKPGWYKHIGEDEIRSIKTIVTKEQFAAKEYHFDEEVQINDKTFA